MSDATASLDDALALFGTLDRLVNARAAVFAAANTDTLATSLVDLAEVLAELDGDVARVAARLVIDRPLNRELVAIALKPEDVEAARATEVDGEAHDRALVDTGIKLAAECFGAIVRSEAASRDLMGIPDLLGRLERWIEIVKTVEDIEELTEGLNSKTPHRRRRPG